MVNIHDLRWLGSLIGNSMFLSAVGLVAYVWVTSMLPSPGSLISSVVYYGFLIALLIAIAALLRAGFTCRWTTVSIDGLVIHDGYYGLRWKTKELPISRIAQVEHYVEVRPGAFTRIAVAGIRVRSDNGATDVLTEMNGERKLMQEYDELRRLLPDSVRFKC